MLLEKEHDNFNQENQERKQSELGLEEVRKMHKQVIDDLNHQRKKGGLAVLFPDLPFSVKLSNKLAQLLMIKR